MPAVKWHTCGLSRYCPDPYHKDCLSYTFSVDLPNTFEFQVQPYDEILSVPKPSLDQLLVKFKVSPKALQTVMAETRPKMKDCTLFPRSAFEREGNDTAKKTAIDDAPPANSDAPALATTDNEGTLPLTAVPNASISRKGVSDRNSPSKTTEMHVKPANLASTATVDAAGTGCIRPTAGAASLEEQLAKVLEELSSCVFKYEKKDAASKTSVLPLATSPNHVTLTSTIDSSQTHGSKMTDNRTMQNRNGELGSEPIQTPLAATVDETEIHTDKPAVSPRQDALKRKVPPVDFDFTQDEDDDVVEVKQEKNESGIPDADEVEPQNSFLNEDELEADLEDQLRQVKLERQLRELRAKKRQKLAGVQSGLAMSTVSAL